MEIRPRRLRKNSIIRDLVAETRLSRDMFIYPYFVCKGTKVVSEIKSMPGINHYSVDTLIEDVAEGLKIGINKILLFGANEMKTDNGSSSYDKNNVIGQSIRELKKRFGDDIYIVTDVCLCGYTSHGHCGLLNDGYVDNDSSLNALTAMALMHAEAGADMVSPSDMMDGRVEAIREVLDENKYSDVAIMSYAVKYASSYYGPFRDAADCTPQGGDRKSYQMDVRNKNEGLKEADLDELEGADILMVKPALAYLDIIKSVKENTNLPVACYNVSGEYSMLKNAAINGLVDEEQMVMENMYAFARAGADIIISYHTKDILKNNWIK
ncbi:MAG: porphobilinogen synthase [Flavobacteriales bacterium]|nr:porphobilinogen synthase [Flavobacteriales bacterium]